MAWTDQWTTKNTINFLGNFKKNITLNKNKNIYKLKVLVTPKFKKKKWIVAI